MEKTTIQVSVDTLERLRGFKKYSRQSYDEVLNKIFDEASVETLSSVEINEIQAGLEDVKKGRVHSIESVAKELGVSLK